MLGRLLDAFPKKKTLLDEASQESLLMLVADKQMFSMVVSAIKDDAPQHIRSRIGAMDKDVNRQQREVRKKVFEHLTLSNSNRAGLLRGLELVTAVIDLERIGDYTKNMGEIVEMMPDSVDFGEFEGVYEEGIALVEKMFDFCIVAFSRQDADAAKKVMEAYVKLSALADGTLETVMRQARDGGDSVSKSILAVCMLMRYVKRVGAHLKNVASAQINPFDRIGFRFDG